MPTPTLAQEVQEQCLSAYRKALKDGCRPWRTEGEGASAVQRAAQRLHEDRGGSHSTWRSRLRSTLERLPASDLASLHDEPDPHQPVEGAILPRQPDGDQPVEHLIEHLTQRFEKKKEAWDARKWRRIQITDPGPFAVAFIGDPHVDNHGCHWPLLRRDVDIIKSTPHLFAANAGDSVDNWTGRLLKLKGKNPVTDQDAWRLAKWLIDELADKWLMFVLGNHDSWNEGATIFKHLCANVVEPDDWQAQIILQARNGTEFPVWLSHSFKGSSIYNPLHGPMRAAKFTGRACLYVQGHHHEWGIHQEEDADKGLVFSAVKARGYKFLDDYATVHGFPEQQEGATITAVFDPDASSAAGAVRCIADLEEAAEFLTWKRARYERAA